MPLPDRVISTETAPGVATADLRDRALAVLTAPDLAHVVDIVAYADGDGIVVANAEGASRISRADPDTPAVVLHGRDPVADQDPLAFSTFEAEVADPSPPNARSSYPFAGRRLASLLAEERAPDLVVVHTGRHYWPERGGHLGEHGSLNAVQSRAPLVVSGAGVTRRGVVPTAARIVDVGATLGWLAGVPDEVVADLDGAPLRDVVDRGAAHVVGLLWDGASATDLLRGAQAGELPAVARLLDRGCALQGGAIAEFPSVTLVNHTCALTGLGPGRHGIVNNAYYDRELRERVVPNDSATWYRAMELLRPGARTLFELIAEARPGAVTVCIDEPADRGATYSTFSLIRAAGGASAQSSMRSALPHPADDPHATREHVEANPDYAWGTQVDASGLVQALEQWSGAEPPAFMWWNTTLTDAGHHAGGPRSPIARAALADSDRRLGVWLDLLTERGLLDDTVILLTADHGFEGADPDCRGDWDEALKAAGIPFRDEAYGFIYLGADVVGDPPEEGL